MAGPFRKDRLMKPRFWGPLAPLTLGLAIIVFGIDQLHKYWMLDV